MTWLYVPGISSPCAQASEGSNLVSPSLSDCAANRLAASVTWRGKPQPQQVWSRRWRQGGFIRRLSGLTCSPSTLDHGVASFISSLQEIPAKTTALPETGQALRESDSLLPRLSALPKSAGLIISSARTCRGTLTDSFKHSSRHWKDWATALRAEYSARPKPEIPCAGSECSSWPSARAEDSESAGKRISRGVSDTLTAVARDWMAPRVERGSYTRDNGNPDLERLTLEGQATQWEAPSVAVTEGSRMTRGGNRSGELLLTGQAIQTSQALQWPAPAARDFKGTNSTEHVTENSTGSMHLDQLPNFVEFCFHLPSSRAPATLQAGSTSLIASQNTNQPSAKRKLNPIFVEALMRWPTGLSGFERPAMASIQWQQRMLSYLSTLFSLQPEPAQADLFGGL